MKVLFAPASPRAHLIERPLRAVGVEVRSVRQHSERLVGQFSVAGRSLALGLLNDADVLLSDLWSRVACLALAPLSLGSRPMVIRLRGDPWQQADDLDALGLKGWRCYLLRQSLLRRMLHRAAAVVPVSEALRDSVLAHAHLDPDKVIAIPIPADTQRFVPPADPERVKRELGLDYPHIVALANTFEYVQKVKGAELFLPVLRALVEEHPDVAVVIAGHGSLHEAFRQRNRELLDHPRIIMPGHLPQIEKLYQSSDAFAHFSLFDACPNVLLEAWACERPVVVNDYPPLLENLDPGVNGYVLPAAMDVHEAVAILARLIYDAEHRRRLGQEGRRMVTAKFSDVAIGRRLQEVLERTIPH